MTEKNKQRLLAGGLIVAALIILWLLLRGQSTPAAATSPTVATNQGSGQLPEPGGNTVGPLTYNVGPAGPININTAAPSIPSLAGLTMPNISYPNGATDACCSSCGCDSTSPLNMFAAGVGAALSNYASQMNALESSYQASLFGNLPNYIAQYVSTAAPSSPVNVL